MHVGRALIVANHTLTVEQHVAFVPTSLVAKHRHQRRRTAATKRDQRRQVGNVQIAVAIEHEKGLAQERQRLTQRAARAQKFVAIETIDDLKSELPTIAHDLDLNRSSIGSEVDYTFRSDTVKISRPHLRRIQ